jgi:UDP-N-acetylglucosamine 1-carboxyvinyltransferase
MELREQQKGCVAMSRLIINGGRPLQGSVRVQGAKNSALPVLAASLMCGSRSVIHNCPELTDVGATMRILEYLGCAAAREGDAVTVDPQGLGRCDIPDRLMREMRSSIVFLGAIAAALGRARISFPGGCELGPRPIDLHLSALRQLGLEIDEDGGWLDCRVHGRLRGADIALAFPSVGATENIILAAATADGTTVILNAAREPEIVDLADYLTGCGARISGAGTGTIVIEGTERLHGCEHRVIPDRIVAATLMAAAAVTGGEIELRDICPEHLSPVMPAFRQLGCEMSTHEGTLAIKRPGRLMPLDCVRTMPYPGFPTDAQAPLMAAATLADGTSMFIENMFASRFKHAAELGRMGAKINIEGRVAVVEGVKKLRGTSVESTDLRGGAALVVAALAAEGTTQIDSLRHIDRGYESIERTLALLGADAVRRT